MRSVFSAVKGGGRPSPVRDPAGRPEVLRRRTLAANARIIIVASALALPVAFYFLAKGMVLPFALGMIGLGIGFLTLGLHHRGRYEQAASGQVYGIVIVGLLLAVVDPAIADFGLATALLAPVLASLLTRTPVKKRTWVATVVVVAFSAAAAIGLIAWPEPNHPEYSLAAGLVFATTAILVALTGNRLNSAFEVYEKAQVNAYRHLIEHVQDAVMRFSAEGGLLFASRSSERLFGCQRYEIAGTGLLERMHVLDRPTYLTAFAETNVDGRSRTVEVRMRRDDATEPSAVPQFIWVEMALSPVIDGDADTGPYEVVALLRDVTDRKDQEAEMRRAHKLAEEASAAKSHFLATIGHELRTPLNAIVGFSEMMTSGIVGEMSQTQKEYASLIHKSGTHLIEVVSMLLDVSRIEAGKFELQTEAFDPGALIEPCLEIVDKMAREKGIRMVAQTPGNLPPIVADERACRQILINLLANAIKFSHENAAVTISMKRQGLHLNISVADTGIGMGEADVRRIGEPFFQAQEGLARRYEGTGLGLSIVKHLIELHDGTLHAVSTPGQGTTMTVLLPVNGPAIKLDENASVTPLPREPASQQMPAWHDERKRAL